MENYFEIHVNILCIKIVGKKLIKKLGNKKLLKIFKFVLCAHN